jgi:hypothetical protein
MGEHYLYDTDLDTEVKKIKEPTEEPLASYKNTMNLISRTVKSLKQIEQKCTTDDCYQFFNNFSSSHMYYYRQRETETD